MRNKITLLSFAFLVLLAFSFTFAQTFTRIGTVPLPPPQNASFGNFISGVDFDGDGRPEIYAVNNNWGDSGPELIPTIFKFEYDPYTQTWPQVWTTKLNIPLQNTWPALTWGDWDKDGKKEIIWGPVNNFTTGNENPARVVVFETAGDGSDVMGVPDGLGGFKPNAQFTITPNNNQNLRPIRWVLTDIDKDGTDELIYVSRVNAAGPGNIFGVISVNNIPDNADGSEIWTLETSGDGTTIPTNTAYDMAVMDSTIYIIYANGNVAPVTYSGGVYTVQPTLTGLVPGGSWLSASVVDINNDATKEIVVAGNGTAERKVYLLQGTGATLTATAIADLLPLIGSGTAPRLYGSDFGDIDNDGKIDFVFGTRDATPNAAILRLEYEGTFIDSASSYVASLVDAGFAATGGRWALVDIADVDGDAAKEVLYSEMTDAMAPIVVTDETGSMPAIPLFKTTWQRAVPTSNLPTWFGSNTERGFAYGKVGGNDRVYVVNRNAGTFVKILDAATGADVGDLNTTGITGGTFPLNDIGVTDDGKIIGSNLLTAAGDFKLYMWDDESSAPNNFLTYTTAVTVRLGDKITVRGDYSAGTAEIWAASATTGVVYKWVMNGGTFDPTPIIITLSDAPAPAVIGSAGVGPLPDGSFYWSGNGSNVKKYAADGTLFGTVPGTVVATGSNISRYLGQIGNDEYLAVFAYGTGNGNARILRIPNGVPEDAVLYEVTPSLQVNANANGTGDVDVVFNNFVATVFVLCTNNGLGAYEIWNLDFTPPVPARVQIVHNSADVLADSVDIYVNGTLLLDNFAFRTATPFVDVPSTVTLNIGVAPKTSTSVADTLVNFPVVLAEGEKYIVFANGVLDPGLYVANPDGRSTAFTLLVKTPAQETAVGSGVDLFVLHGITDAPTIDIKARELGNAVLVDDAAYGDITGYLNAPAQPVTLDVYLSDGATLLGSFAAPLAGLDGQSLAVFASGFANESGNQNGAGGGIFAALANGTVVELPLITSIADARVDNNADLIPDRLGNVVTIRGTVISPNYQTVNHSYYIWDGTAGITEFLSGTTNPVLSLGDDVFITGTISQFRGLTQIQPANSGGIILISQGNPTPPILEITLADYLANPEAYEGTLVGFLSLTKASGTWPSPGSSATIQLTDGVNTIDYRIDSDTDLDDNPEPVWPKDVVGIGSQFSSGASVVNNGYQILGRYYGLDILPANSIPVEMTTFTAKFINKGVTLTWSTATETNNKGFEIERKSENTEWTKIGFVNGFGTTTEAREYTFTDKNLAVGKYSYRLKQVDFDGTFDYSKVVEVEVLAPKVFELAQNYPNPFNPTTKINYSVPFDSKVIISIYSVTGELVKELVNDFVTAGSYSVDFNGTDLASGMYIYRMVAGDFVQTQKMMLMK